MREILKPIGAAEKLCGVQKEKSPCEYRRTKHFIAVSCGDGELWYHTLTGELILMQHGDDETSRRGELIKKWFLVPTDFDENKFSDDIRRLAAMLKPKAKNKNDFTIFTTTDCNARCYYCYEKGVKRVPMSDKTAKDAADYIARSCGGENVRLRWFGGEPLYNIRAIDIITSELAKKGIGFKSSMTSNGFYLTEEISKKAVSEWKLGTVQITIDGTEKVYNRTKAFVDDCENPFFRVLDNIDHALDAGINVFIRLNVDKGNAADMADAVDVLGKRFGGRGKCGVIVALLRSFAGKVNEFDTEDDAVKCYFDLAEKIRSYGLFEDKPLSREFVANRCMADSDASEVILPDGRLGKCEHFSDRELIGSIYSAERDEEMIASWRVRRTSADMPECGDCPLYPKCINIQKCEWTRSGCPASVRMIRERKTKRQILREYEKTKNATEDLEK